MDELLGPHADLSTRMARGNSEGTWSGRRGSRSTSSTLRAATGGTLILVGSSIVSWSHIVKFILLSLTLEREGKKEKAGKPQWRLNVATSHNIAFKISEMGNIVSDLSVDIYTSKKWSIMNKSIIDSFSI